jgi:hypothetical protein
MTALQHKDDQQHQQHVDDVPLYRFLMLGRIPYGERHGNTTLVEVSARVLNPNTARPLAWRTAV